jgi:putative AdoMet-dependent methyltransferase
MPEIVFPVEEFDRWAETYDLDVLEDAFPFAGYARALATTLSLAEVQPGMRVLDVGTGTGNLARLFYERGCRLWCSDFSPEMIAKARRKLPEAVYAVADLRDAWPKALIGPFDRIVSAYVFHHFRLDEKIDLLQRMAEVLAPGGWMVMADIAFTSPASKESFRRAVGDAWEEEYYWIAEEVLPPVERAGFFASFQSVSLCAGVFVFRPV